MPQYGYGNPVVLPPGARRVEGSEGYWTTDPVGGSSGMGGVGGGGGRGGGGGGTSDPRGMSTDELALIQRSIGSAGGAGTPYTAPTYGGADLTEKHRLAFGRAKDRAGKIGKASLRGLRESMAARGLLGSGIESAGTAGLHGDVAENLSNVVTQQASEQAGADTHAANQNFNAQQQAAQMNFNAQQQAAQRAQAMQQSLLGLIQSAGGLYDSGPQATSPYGGLPGRQQPTRWY